MIVDTDEAATTQTVAETDPELLERRKALRELNRKYPNDPPFGKKAIFKVEKVEVDGVIVLENMKKITLMGLNCNSEESVSFLSRFLQDKTVTFVEVSNSDLVNTGYLWVVDYSFLADPKLQEAVKGPSFSCLNEIALLSGWCEIDESSKHPLKKRFSKLQKIFEESQ